MEKFEIYFTELINSKITLNEENINLIKSNYSVSLSDFASLSCGLNAGLIISHSPHFSIANILLGFFAVFYSGYTFYLCKRHMKGLSIKDTLKSKNINIEDIKDIYTIFMKDISLNKEEIVTFMDKINDLMLNQNEIDYCIKKTMLENENLDMGNLLFMFKLYENLKEYSETKNDPILIKKLNIQNIGKNKEQEELTIKIKEELKNKEFA